jgi:hypothetical protein
MEDGYLGSGTVWKNLLKAHPASEFSREVLGFFDSKQEVADAEKDLITEEVLRQSLCMNEALGGTGGNARNFWKNSSAKDNAIKGAGTLIANPVKLKERNALVGEAHRKRLAVDPTALDANLQKMHELTRGSTKETSPWIIVQVEARRKNHINKMNNTFSQLISLGDMPVSQIVQQLGVSKSTVMRMRAKARQGQTSWATQNT